MSKKDQDLENGDRLPVIGITIGDAAGIGPEVVLKTVADPRLRDVCIPVVIGDLELLKRESRSLGIGVDLVPAAASVEFGSEDEAIEVFDLSNLKDEHIDHGVESAVSGRAAGEYIEKAVELWRAGKIDAITSAPISKRSLGLGGYDYPGHTEFLAHLTGSKEYRMSFMAGDLRVILLSTHLPLRKAIDRVTKQNLVDLIRFTEKELSRLLGRDVRLALAGLNPHASEGGMFGSEEEAEMVPAVKECRETHGIDISGPFSPDTIFIRAGKGEFDGVIACYHDQATIAVKAISFGESVNVTLGLPLIRTSVDHGTAFDIAGKGVADGSSMKAAVIMAAEFAALRSGSAVRSQFC